MNVRRTISAAVVAVAALTALWAAYGMTVRGGRAPRRPPIGSEVRGAWHVHTTASDGRGTLDEVAGAAREAGLQFLVVSDHNVMSVPAPAYRGGVLLVPATEASTRHGHVVAIGVPRALARDELEGDPLGAIRALGGEAVLAHPLHPRRPFTGWGTGPWRGFEVVSNDTAWHRAIADRAAAKVLAAALVLPWDPPRAVLDLVNDPALELARFDAEERAAAQAGEPRRPARVLLCSADAHGHPSYLAAFEAFSMHVPVTLSGDAAADARAVAAGLLDGSASCVFDGVAPASGVRLAEGPERGQLFLRVDSPDHGEARYDLIRDGRRIGSLAPGIAGSVSIGLSLACEKDVCPPGAYRVEGRWNGRPWLYTNPIRLE